MTICDMHSLHLCRAIAVRNSGPTLSRHNNGPPFQSASTLAKVFSLSQPDPAENPVLNEIAGNSIRPSELTTTLAKGAPVYSSLILFLREFLPRCKNCTLLEDYLAVRPSSP